MVGLCEPGRKSLSVDEVWTASPLLPVANHIGTSTNIIGQVRPAHSQRRPALNYSLAETYNKNGFWSKHDPKRVSRKFWGHAGCCRSG